MYQTYCIISYCYIKRMFYPLCCISLKWSEHLCMDFGISLLFILIGVDYFLVACIRHSDDSGYRLHIILCCCL